MYSGEAMALVVIGHLSFIGNYIILSDYISLFHMSLIFSISGYIFGFKSILKYGFTLINTSRAI